jgi:hypothetical protein
VALEHKFHVLCLLLLGIKAWMYICMYHVYRQGARSALPVYSLFHPDRPFYRPMKDFWRQIKSFGDYCNIPTNFQRTIKAPNRILSFRPRLRPCGTLLNRISIHTNFHPLRGWFRGSKLSYVLSWDSNYLYSKFHLGISVQRFKRKVVTEGQTDIFRIHNITMDSPLLYLDIFLARTVWH